MNERSSLRELTPKSSSQSLLPQRSGASTGTRCSYQVRGIGSKGAVLIIVWTFFAIVSAVILGVLPFQTTVDYEVALAYVYGMSAVVLAIGPIAGLLASIYFGRYGTLNTGLWLVWAGSVFTCGLAILQRFFLAAHPNLIFSGQVVATTGSSVGLTLIIATAIPFGLDQLPDGSGEQIVAFIHWYTWSILAGILTPSVLGYTMSYCARGVSKLKFQLFLSLLAVVLMSLTLCSKFLLHRWLIVEPKGPSPLNTFLGVLKFAAKHKIPVRRSAFTYWEADRPSRLDLAKAKYGGPFTHEEVENVKACLRMGVVLASISVTMSTFWSHLVSFAGIIDTLAADRSTICSIHLLSITGIFATLIGFIVYELFIHPLTKKWTSSTLRRIGWSQTLSMIASLLLLASTTVWYMNSNPTTCMFASEGSAPFPVDFTWIEIPYSILAFTFLALVHSAMLEFVCAQAPYVLRGLLVGLVYSVALCSSALGAGVYLAWKHPYQENAPNSPSCGVWFYLFTTITAILGCVLWCAVAKWYKRRERDEPDMCRIFAENYYDH